MRNILTILLIAALAGCNTFTRPTQGDRPACVMWALADYCEIVYHKSISQAERVRVWDASEHNDSGMITIVAVLAAEKAGWCPKGTQMDTVSDPLTALKDGPIICIVKRNGEPSHAVVGLSYVNGYIMYLDPQYVDPIAIHVSEIGKRFGLTYWRLK